MDTTNDNPFFTERMPGPTHLTGTEDPAVLLAQDADLGDMFCCTAARYSVRKVLNKLHELRGDPGPAKAKTSRLADGTWYSYLSVNRSVCTKEQWLTYQRTMSARYRALYQP